MIYINDIPSLRDPDSVELTFDDRIEKIELINGNAVQNYGHIESGDTFSLTAIFKKTDYQRIVNLWESDTKINYTDESGEVHQNLRLVLRRKKYLAKFPKYVELTFELWKA